jgi:drug/metabolite transporter (DMT)-like permease
MGGMPVVTILLILLAASMHAGWNTLLRSGADRMWSMTVMSAAVAAACALLALVVPAPAQGSWGCVLASAVIHVGYNLFLVRTYRSGDLGQTYPIARGASPLLVSLGAAVFAGEWPGLVSVSGVLLVAGGILSLAFQGRRISRDVVPWALGTGCFIGAYTVVDGIGARLSGAPVGYTVWMCLIQGAMTLPFFAVLRGWRSLIRGRRETLIVAGGGLISLVAYGIVILAMSLGPMGPVSALRETSVVFAALFGRLFLKEKLTAWRLAACAVIAVGAVFIGYGGGTR